MTISKSRRQAVRDRAGNCCEYCRLPASAGTVAFHVDHIIPLKHGGKDDMSNLSLACYKCNAHKGYDLAGLDPQTQAMTLLYNPRTLEWDEHFLIRENMRIDGMTPQGRTTIRVLQMNDQNRVENRQLLAEMGEYPCKKP
jgi:hypothetical protein